MPRCFAGSLLVCLIASALSVSGVRAATALALWQEVCADFQLNYSYTAYKGIDWTNLYEANKTAFEQELPPDRFAEALNEALTVLRDWHVAVRKPDGTWIGYQRAFPRNYPEKVVLSYAPNSYENLRGANAVVHARLANGAAHIICPPSTPPFWIQLATRISPN